MACKILQAMVLPLLFALLGAGGKTTFCAVLSVVGLEAHHHAHHEEDGVRHGGPFCLDAHEGEEHDHEHDPVPCPESCELQLAEATAPSPLKLPSLVEIDVPLATGELLLGVLLANREFVSGAFPDPPDEGPPLSAPCFTGRFLI